MVSGKPGLVFFCWLIWAVTALSGPFLAQTQAPLYVGSDACVACHEDVAKKIADSPTASWQMKASRHGGAAKAATARAATT